MTYDPRSMRKRKLKKLETKRIEIKRSKLMERKEGAAVKRRGEGEEGRKKES